MLAGRPKMVPSKLSPEFSVFLIFAWIWLNTLFFGLLWLSA